jgi:hypothetical protein
MSIRTIIGGGLLTILAGCSEPEILPELAPVKTESSRTYTPNQQLALDITECLQKKDYTGAQALLDTRKTDNVPSLHYLQAITHVSQCKSPRATNIAPLLNASSEFEKILDGFQEGEHYLKLIRDDMPADFETIPVYQKRMTQLKEFIEKPSGGWYDIVGPDLQKQILGCCNAILCLNALIFRRYDDCVATLPGAWPVLKDRAFTLITSVDKWQATEKSKHDQFKTRGYPVEYIEKDVTGLKRVYEKLFALNEPPDATAELKVEPTAPPK